MIGLWNSCAVSGEPKGYGGNGLIETVCLLVVTWVKLARGGG